MTSSPPQDPRPSLHGLLADPAARYALKAVLRAWSDRDPVDAAEDAGLLALAFERRADEHLVRAAVWRHAHLPRSEDHDR